MSKENLTANLDASVVSNVQKFAAVGDIRYYLNGVHVVPGTADVPARIEGTNGHMLYVEEDKSAHATRDLIISISKRGHALLKDGNRVKVYDDGALHIVNKSGAVLYVEPGKAVIDAQFPVIDHLVGVPTDWHEGLVAPCNTGYLQKVFALPGYVRFFSRKDAEGNFTYASSVMFVVERSMKRDGKAMGLIMPVRTDFGPGASVADMLPASLVPSRGPARVAA